MTGRPRKARSDVNGTASSREDPKVDALFTASTADKDAAAQTLGMDEVEKYCASLDVTIDDISFVVLSHFLESPRMGEIGRKAFVQAWSRVSASTLKAQKVYLHDHLVPQFCSDGSYFGSVYTYVYNWLCEPGKRQIDKEAAIELWKTLFASAPDSPTLVFSLSTRSEWVDRWTSFVEQSPVKNISRDVWAQFLAFAQTIDSVAKYSVDDAWPSLIDSFMETVPKP